MFKINEDFILRNVLDEYVIVPIKCPDNNTDFYTLNESGAIIMNAIAAGADKKGIIDAVCEKYDVEFDEAQADVEEFTAQFVQKGIISEY